MDTALIEGIVDAAAAELGSAATAATVRELAGRVAEGRPEGGPPPGVLGLEVHVNPDLTAYRRGHDMVLQTWEVLERTLAALPRSVPVLPHLSPLSEIVEGLDAAQIERFCDTLDDSMASKGLPALRLQWADAVSPRRTDRTILEALPRLLAGSSRISGHVRVAIPGKPLNRDALTLLMNGIAGISSRPALGLACSDAAGIPSGVRICAVGRCHSTEDRVALGGWLRSIVAVTQTRSGLSVDLGKTQLQFDAPVLSPDPMADLESVGAGIVWV